jgi:hypothetical protein
VTGAPSKSLSWSHGVFSVETLGGMLGPTLFVLPDGRQIAPFHIAPWFAEETAASQPGILQRLRGEWPCVPFGAATDRAAIDGWPASAANAEPDPHPHGYAANHHWHWIPAAAGEIALAIDYPAEHPIARCERRIAPVPGQPGLAFTLSVMPRADCTLPIGLHPVFRLPAETGGLRLAVTARAAATFPGRVDASSVFLPGQITADWRAVTLTDGTTLDPGHLPLARHSEDLLQLIGVPGEATLHNPAENHLTRLTWNPQHFPDLLLWISNHGRQHAPWNGRHRALGVEPVCAAFDLGTQISAAPNPISALGGPTARRFYAGEEFVTRYRVTVEAITA